MAKLLLVEDDNNLREIYQARLSAEGYEIIAAQNGEEALVVAKQQRPDLIISDVMMPRISGFEMLDILRATPELATTKVIMLTALGQAEDQERAGKLGADKYLVKSQVTLEDIVNCAHELLEGGATAALPALDSPVTSASTTSDPVAVSPSTIVEPTAAPAASPTVPMAAAQPVTPVSPSPTPTTVPLPSTAPAADPITVISPLSEPAAHIVSVTDPDPVTVSAAHPLVTGPEIITHAAPVMQQPVTATPIPNPVAAANDATINNAVEQLGAAVSTPPAPLLPPSQNPLPAGTAVDAPTQPAAVIAVPAPAEQNTEGQSLAPVTESAQVIASPTVVQNEPPNTAETEQVAVAGKKVIKPINDIEQGPNLDELLAKEVAKEQGEQVQAAPSATGIVTGGEDAPGSEEPQPQAAVAKTPEDDPNSIAL